MGNQVQRLHTVWMDGGYRGEDFMRARDGYVTVDCRNCSQTLGEKGFSSFTKALGRRAYLRLGSIGVGVLVNGL